MREGMASNVTQPKLVMVNVVEQLDAMLAAGRRGNSFLKPVQKFPAAIPAAEQARLKAAYARPKRTKIRPALTRLRTSLPTNICPRRATRSACRRCPAATSSIAYLAQSSTTTDLTPDQIHRIGLSEVTRLQAEMEGGQETGRLRRHAQGIFRAYPHRPQIQAGIARVAAERNMSRPARSSMRRCRNCSRPCPRRRC